MSERFKEHAWKACVGEILPWVRIPLSPPHSFPLANRRKSYDLSKMQRAARPEACARRREIPTTARVSPAWLAAGKNHADPHALPQGPAGLVAQIPQIAWLAQIGTRQK
jgi:hypothetical protein